MGDRRKSAFSLCHLLVAPNPRLRRPLPSLKSSPTYIQTGKGNHNDPSIIRDPDIERAMLASSSFDVPAPPKPPSELTKSGKPLTKKEKKAASTSDLLDNLIAHHLTLMNITFVAEEYDGWPRLV